jgi:hypothetical protein
MVENQRGSELSAIYKVWQEGLSPTLSASVTVEDISALKMQKW